MVENEIKDDSYIYRYDDKEPKSPEFVRGNDQLIEGITNHIEKHLGSISSVMHEKISQDVHIDVHVIYPTEERNFYTLVTAGMSEKPMILRTEQGNFEIYAELMISLPSEWKITKEYWNDENNYWPIRWLYILTHFPHASDTCLFVNDSIPNGDPAEPLANNTGFIGFIVGFPKLVSEDFIYLTDNNNDIVFLALYPVYHDEMMYKLEEGANKFFELADSANLTELVDIRRKSIIPQRTLLEKIVNFIRH